MSWIRGRTQLEPFSTGTILSPGKRVHRPWPMAEATVSVMARWLAWVMAAKAPPPLNGVNSSPGTPSHSLR